MSSTAPFSIAPHVHVCVTGDGSVLLDLKRDKYLGLGRKDTELLAAAIGSWPKPRWKCTEAAPSSDATMAHTEELCRSLAADGLLTSGVSDGAQAAAEPPLIDMKQEWISVGDELEVESQVTVRHVANFVAAFLWARCSLAWRPFFATVEAIRVEKARRGREADLIPVLEMAALVGVFRQLRPFAFAAEGRCLLHALTLIRFLSRYGFCPEWVIGVATQPWAAHSWVQLGVFLLDTNPEKVCRYTPIMAV
jgi:Transglutaminase-like superfamily